MLGALLKRTAVGGLAGAVLGSDSDDILMGAALGAAAPGLKGIVAGATGKIAKIPGSSYLAKANWKRIGAGAGVAGLGYGLNKLAHSDLVNQSYSSYMGQSPQTESTLRGIKAIGTGAAVTGGLLGAAHIFTGYVPGRGVARGVAGAAKATPGFARGVIGAKQAGRVQDPVTKRYITQPGYKAGQRLRTRAAQYRPLGAAKATPGFTRGVMGMRPGRMPMTIDTGIGQATVRMRGARQPGYRTGQRLRERVGGSFSNWRKLPWPEWGSKGPNKLGAIGRHPFMTAGGAGLAAGTGAGMVEGGRRQMRVPPPGRIIGIDNGSGGGINPALNLSTQGLGLNLHNRRRRRVV